MSKKTLFLVSVLGVAGILIAGSIVFSKNYAKSRQERSDMAIGWISSLLDLTETQTSNLISLNDEMVNLESELKKDKKGIKNELISMIAADELDQARVLEMIEEKQKQLHDYAPRIVAELANFQRSLSPEQRKKLIDQIQYHRHTDSSHQHFQHRYH